MQNRDPILDMKTTGWNSAVWTHFFAIFQLFWSRGIAERKDLNMERNEKSWTFTILKRQFFANDSALKFDWCFDDDPQKFGWFESKSYYTSRIFFPKPQNALFVVWGSIIMVGHSVPGFGQNSYLWESSVGAIDGVLGSQMGIKMKKKVW